MINKEKNIDWILRLTVFGTFLGHGIFALMTKQSWIKYFPAVGIPESYALILLPLIGIMDIAIAFSILVKPNKIILIWATTWAFITAIIRPLSGESIWEFVERAGNFGPALALLFLHKKSKNLKGGLKK